MRLTNEMRSAFADKVISKIPVRSDWTRDKVIAEFEKRLLRSMPEDVQVFAKKYPQIVVRSSRHIRWLDYKDDRGYHYGYVQAIHTADLAAIDTSDLQAAWSEHTAEMDERKALRERVYEQACACTTLAALEVAFPDLKGLMPKPVIITPRSLPVAAKGLTDDLVKLGLEIPQ